MALDPRIEKLLKKKYKKKLVHGVGTPASVKKKLMQGAKVSGYMAKDGGYIAKKRKKVVKKQKK
tara:strand:+ start:679 stop:870 length:192 start_codon:yes stop_codon:yes gene_type:complete